MKNALIISIILAIISFATTVLTYDSISTGNALPQSPALPIEQVVTNYPDPETAFSLSNSSSTKLLDTAEIIVGTSTKMSSQKIVVDSKPAIKKSETMLANIKDIATNVIEPKTKPKVEQATIIEAKKKISWGVFTGSNPTVISDFEDRVKENPDYLAYFIHWGNGEGALPAFLSDFAYKKGRTLVIFWEASDYKIGGTDQPAYSYQAMLDGNFDDYFKSFAGQLRKYKGPVILIPFSELNGNWTPWSGTKNGNTPTLAVEAFRYVHGFFTDLENVKIGWAVNSASVPDTDENQIANYYPGDAFVDIVGVDGFNMSSPWLSFDEIFGKSLNIISKHNKPMFIFSFGSAEGPQKAAWLDDALNVEMPKYRLLEAWIYFNQNKERNWLLWSDKETFSVFLNYISK